MALGRLRWFVADPGWIELSPGAGEAWPVPTIFNQQDAMTEFDTLLRGASQAMKDGSG